MRIPLVECKKHPGYKVMRAPTSMCRDCWRQWVAKQANRWDSGANKVLRVLWEELGRAKE